MQNASKYFFFTFHSSAEDTHNQTKAALKKLARPFQNEIFAKRCYREIRMLRHFDHENVSVQSSVDEVLRVDGGCVAGHEACRVKNKGRTVECHFTGQMLDRKRWLILCSSLCVRYAVRCACVYVCMFECRCCA